MTARVELAEFLSAYLAEVDEHVAVASARLLSIEASQKSGDANPRAVRDLFRALHTIKGLSAMVGIEPIVGVTHRMEAVVRAADRAGGKLAMSAIDPLLQGVRAITHRVSQLAERKAVSPAPASLLAALDGLEGGEAVAGVSGGPTLALEPALREKLAAFEQQQLLGAGAEGKRAVRLEFVPSVARSSAGQTINSVRERVSAIGEIVKVLPVAVVDTERAPSGLAFVLLVVTAESDEALAEAAGVELTALRPLEQVEPPRARESRNPAPSSDRAPGGVDEPPLEQPDDLLEDELGLETIERRSVMRVDVERVDDAMEKLGGLIVSRSRLARAVAKLPPQSPEGRELRQLAADLGRQLRDLRTAILQVRMVRVTETLERLPLVARSLLRATGKQARLQVDAGEAELDKAVAERLFPALLHLVRNAIDHGIEAPDARRAAGKPPEGLVRISASARSNTQLEILVSDDGGGIDGPRVASRQKVPPPASDAALLELLCRPGFSTRDEVTATSGRGMGMDIVKGIVVDQLGGEVFLSTQIGVGTKFTLHVPLTVSIVDAFVVEAGASRFAVPVSMVEEIVDANFDRVLSAPVLTRDGAVSLGMIERRGEAVPLLSLARFLGQPMGASGVLSAKGLVVRRVGGPVAFLLDRVLGQQEAVVRPLVDPLVQVTGVSGATDLGDGRPTLVLDLVGLAALGLGALGAGIAREGALPAAPAMRYLPPASSSVGAGASQAKGEA